MRPESVVLGCFASWCRSPEPSKYAGALYLYSDSVSAGRLVKGAELLHRLTVKGMCLYVTCSWWAAIHSARATTFRRLGVNKQLLSTCREESIDSQTL